jgi:hypothetical protein
MRIINKIRKLRNEQPFYWSIVKASCLFAFVLCIFIIVLSHPNLDEYNIGEATKQYFDTHDYYISGKIIQCADFNGYRCAIRIKIDCIVLDKTNNDIYIGYINKDSTEAVFYTIFVNYYLFTKKKEKDITITINTSQNSTAFYKNNILMEETQIVINRGTLLEFEKTIDKWDLKLDDGWIRF